MKEEVKNLKLLGNKRTIYPKRPNKNILEYFDNKFPKNFYEIEHKTSEITSLCRKTGQPDFGTITIYYIPNKKLVESKSLKLYLQSYRYERTFMEPMVNRILNDLVKVIEPIKMKVIGDYNARGGIALKATAIFSTIEEDFL